MKYVAGRVLDPEVLSLPARGARIEILLTGLATCKDGSRSPQGERGLKFHRVAEVARVGAVAPRKGSAD